MFSKIEQLPEGVSILIVFAGAFLIGGVLAAIAMRFLDRIIKKTKFSFDDVMIRYLNGPLYLLIPVLLLVPAAEIIRPALLENRLFSDPHKILIVALLTWLAIRIVNIAADLIKQRFDVSASDNLAARRVHTQIIVAKRIVIFVIALLAFASIFMMFDQLKSLGVSLLASAGIAGIVIGFAAQKTLGNLLAGIQIALTQPIRIDDVVIVENEWGWIEEITLTYVVVRIWDLRRLILPISYFIETPFQNWTRTSADILGTVYLHTDYTLPIEPLRKKLQEILEHTDLWDGKVASIQITDTTQETMVVRALVSALDSSKAWDLRCLVREELLTYIQENYPQSLPKTRAALEA